MDLIPAIYIKDNQTVKIAEGTGIFDPDPLILAAKLANIGVEVVYLNDLNVPGAGTPENLELIDKIIKKTGLRVILTGNFKSTDVAERYVDIGIEKIVLGTIAYQKPDLLKNFCEKFKNKIVTTIEVKAGKVVISGWTIAAHKNAFDYAEQFANTGVSTLLYSDVQEEGKLTHTDIANVINFSTKSPIPIIHSTDLNSAQELELVLALESTKILGTIFSKSIYSGIIDMAATITHIKEKLPDGMDEPTLIP